MLKELWAIGINGKLWRIVKNWYTASSGKVKIQNHISSSLQISRGVKQGSVLSPTFFLIVIDVLLKRMRESNCGLSVRGTYMGAATHADDIRTTAPSKKSVSTQADIVANFMKDTCLKLNSSKLEIVKISSQPQENESVQINDVNICTTSSAKCLGVWWQSNLSAKRSVHENINKSRRAFFALGGLGAFQGELSPLSSSSIFEACITPILLYGCETWLLDSTCLKALESFQCEIGRRILRLPKFYSNNAVRIGLHWPSVATRILLRKLMFLSKLLCSTRDSLSSRVFTSLAMNDIYEISIIQQCKMLESSLDTDILAKCLTSPENAVEIVKTNKNLILKQDFCKLISLSLSNQSSTRLVARVAEHTSWHRLWDMALDKGVKGTRTLQRVFKELSRPKPCSKCNLCETEITEESCFEHTCVNHSDIVGDLSCGLFISTLIEANSDSIFTKCSCCQIIPLCGVFTFKCLFILYNVSFGLYFTLYLVNYLYCIPKMLQYYLLMYLYYTCIMPSGSMLLLLYFASGASAVINCANLRFLVYIYIFIYLYIYIYICMSPYATGHAHLKFTFRKCTSFLNSEYNFQFYWRVINVQQYRVRRNPRAQRCSVF